jgi:hypothetical protein
MWARPCCEAWGFNKVRVFEESWLGYGNDVLAPAEVVQYFPFNTFGGEN